jgi:8-oxo-dGTP diphosphatase
MLMPGTATLLVVAAILRKDRKYLIAQRKDDCKSAPGKWEFPGGKVESGEHPESALKREIMEELGMEIRGLRLFSVTSTSHGPGARYPHIVMISYLAEPVGEKFSLLDCKDAKWVLPGELADYPLIEGDEEIAEMLRKL